MDIDLLIRLGNGHRPVRAAGESPIEAILSVARQLPYGGISLGHPGGSRITDVTIEETDHPEWYLSVTVTTEETGTLPDMEPGRVRTTVLSAKPTVARTRRTWTVKPADSGFDGIEIQSVATSPDAAIQENLDVLREAGMISGHDRKYDVRGRIGISSLGGGGWLATVPTWLDEDRDATPVLTKLEVRPVLDRGGRPSIDGKPGKTKAVPVALGEELTALADAKASSQGISRAELVRRAVAAYVA